MLQLSILFLTKMESSSGAVKLFYNSFHSFYFWFLSQDVAFSCLDYISCLLYVIPSKLIATIVEDGFEPFTFSVMVYIQMNNPIKCLFIY